MLHEVPGKDKKCRRFMIYGFDHLWNDGIMRICCDRKTKLSRADVDSRVTNVVRDLFKAILKE